MNSSASATSRSSAGRQLRILYADDLPQLRDLMTVVLTRAGHSVETVCDGLEAFERLGKSLTAFDLLITDHHMPRMNGLELVRRLRELPFAGKIIVFSSELSEAVNNKYHQYAVDLILPKPIFPLTFLRMLSQLFAPGVPEPELEPSASQSPLG